MNLYSKFIIYLFIAITSFSLHAQRNTVGLLSYDPSLASDGYNLIFPHNQPNVYLLNNCGEIVHTWTDDDNFRPGNTAYLTEEGLLYKAKRDASVAGDAIWAGGGGAILEIRDWDNNLIWSFELNDENNRLHHDFSITPDGTIIAIAWEFRDTEECIAAGKDTSLLAQNVMWPDWVFEIDPALDSIVWEWHAWDHLIQDFDSTKANFGVVADHPELIDINYCREDGHPDWHHSNSIDYNDEIDQIMLSVPYFDEIWIIDHTTTTQQAASSFGGFSNLGGDLMFRWGNPIAYNNGAEEDQRSFFQHDAHWIDDFLDRSHPDYGKIALFNNQINPNYSVANVLNPIWDMYLWEYGSENNVFLPTEFEQTLMHPDTFPLFSTGLSSIQHLQNGNILLLAGRFGYSFELTPNNEIVWEYITPLRAGNPATQGETLDINNNLTFRMQRYPVDFPAFESRDLSSKGWIELEPDSTFCQRVVSVDEVLDESKYKVFPNPADDRITIEWDGMMYANIAVFNAQGQRILNYPRCNGGRKFLDTSNWQNGIYILSIDQEYSRLLMIQH